MKPIRCIDVYIPETIDLEPDNSTTAGAFFGPIAVRFFCDTKLRGRLDELVGAARRSTNRYFVLDAIGETKAAQSTRLSALGYMSPGRVLVSIHL